MFALLFISLLISHSSAQPSQRQVQVHVNGWSLQFQSTTQSGTAQDSLQFNINLTPLGQQTGFLQSFFQHQMQNSSESSQIQMNFDVIRIIEFGSTNVYTGDKTTQKQSWPSTNGIEWNTWVDESKVVNNVQVYSYSATTKTQSPIFAVRVHIVPTDVTVKGTSLNPNDVKIDFEIHNFPYLENGTQLALETLVHGQSNSQTPFGSAVPNQDLRFGPENGLPVGLFSWNPNVNSSKGTVPVVAWSNNTAPSQNIPIFFTFRTNEHPAYLVWDPSMGVDYGIGSRFCMGSLCGPAAGFVVALIVFSGIILLVGAFMLYRRRTGYRQLV